jgi:GDP-mannose transporter
MGLLFLTTGDYAELTDVTFTYNSVALLTVSCVIGCGISYAGWNCRNLVSAATYTLVGVMNKFVTIMLNVLVWDKHASVAGLLSLVLCLGGGFFYQQAPMTTQVQNLQKRNKV